MVAATGAGMSEQTDMFMEFTSRVVLPMVTEVQKRDKVLDQLAETRTKLMSAARATARCMAEAGQEVTSPAVVEQMRVQGYGPELDRVDLRFMGPVFRRGWKRVGYLLGRNSPGSHARAVVIWELDA